MMHSLDQDPEDAQNPPAGPRAPAVTALSHVATLAPFASLTREEARKLLDLATVRRMDEQGAFFHEGDRADHVYLVLEGYVRIQHVTPGGDQVVVVHVGPGQIFGISKVVEHDRYSASARAASDTVALSWPGELWDQITRDYPSFVQETRRNVGLRLHELQEKVVEMATRPVEQRIALAVLRLVDQAGHATPEGVEVGFPITRQDISDLTGTTMHSVSRYMSGWHKDGIVISKRRRVVVCNPDNLRRVADGQAA
ncbi:MAG: Crp/Fnr family transcriptional regulator [Pseudomonadota bacterium]